MPCDVFMNCYAMGTRAVAPGAPAETCREFTPSTLKELPRRAALGNPEGFDGLVFDDQTAWASLIPKVVWRGSDYGMLPGWTMAGEQMGKDSIAHALAPCAGDRRCGESWVTANIARVTPRWAAVLMTW